MQINCIIFFKINFNSEKQHIYLLILPHNILMCLCSVTPFILTGMLNVLLLDPSVAEDPALYTRVAKFILDCVIRIPTRICKAFLQQVCSGPTLSFLCYVQCWSQPLMY